MIYRPLALIVIISLQPFAKLALESDFVHEVSWKRMGRKVFFIPAKNSSRERWKYCNARKLEIPGFCVFRFVSGRDHTFGWVTVGCAWVFRFIITIGLPRFPHACDFCNCRTGLQLHACQVLSRPCDKKNHGHIPVWRLYHFTRLQIDHLHNYCLG